MERHPIELQIDVTEAAALGEPAALALSLFPPVAPGNSAPVLLFCIPGGTRRRGAWDMTVPGRSGYSFAEFASARGCIVCSFDVLGTGDSSRPSDPGFRTEVVARTNDALVRQVSERLRDGTLDPRLERYAPSRTAVIGHSMGGFYAIRQQALFSSYDAVAILGYSTLFPQLLYGRGDQSFLAGLTSEDQLIERGRASGADPYLISAGDREKARPMNYLPDVPDDVIAAHEALKTNTPGYSSSATLIPGIVADDAAAITVPVFLGFAERDTSRDALLEVTSYRGAQDVTFHRLAGSAHATSCATTRQQQWDRILGWLSSLGYTGKDARC